MGTRFFYLEASRAPVDELDCPLGLDASNGGLDILGNDVSTVKQAASHLDVELVSNRRQRRWTKC